MQNIIPKIHGYIEIGIAKRRTIMNDHLYKNTTSKSSHLFVCDFKTVANKNGFTIANENNANMAETFSAHGAVVEENFDLHMIQICKPDKAAPSLQKNPERAILMPKFVMVFNDGKQTQIRFHHHNQKTIREMVDDHSFPKSLAGTYRQIISMIEDSI